MDRVNVAYDSLSYLWHLRLGHINKTRISRMVKDGLLPNLGEIDYPTCEPCLCGKMAKKPFSKATRCHTLLHIIHSDICGPMNV
ncbi:hypothetical protein DVA81_18935, partial [Acinetobacter baumannii]